jgi:hypothetical protein
MSKHGFAHPVILDADDHRDANPVMSRAFSTANVKAVILPATDGPEVLAYLSKSRETGLKIYPWPNLLLVDLRRP